MLAQETFTFGYYYAHYYLCASSHSYIENCSSHFFWSFFSFFANISSLNVCTYTIYVVCTSSTLLSRLAYFNSHIQRNRRLLQFLHIFSVNDYYYYCVLFGLRSIDSMFLRTVPFLIDELSRTQKIEMKRVQIFEEFHSQIYHRGIEENQKKI